MLVPSGRDGCGISSRLFFSMSESSVVVILCSSSAFWGAMMHGGRAASTVTRHVSGPRFPGGGFPLHTAHQPSISGPFRRDYKKVSETLLYYTQVKRASETRA